MIYNTKYFFDLMLINDLQQFIAAVIHRLMQTLQLHTLLDL